MPIYDYACKACGHEFEREQRIHDAPVRKCPGCGKLQAKRLISRTSFVLKGGGWFNDLYASGKPAAGEKSADKSGAEAKSESGGKAGGKADGKSAKDGKAKSAKGKSGKSARGGKEAA